MISEWDKITRQDVLKAIAMYEAGDVERTHARSTFLCSGGKLFPAKHIRALSYMAAYDRPISVEKFHGGKSTATFFEKLGFTVSYKPTRKNPTREQPPSSPSSNGGKQPLKIGLYLQDRCKDEKKKVFNSRINTAAKAGLDILVFPEVCYTPYRREFDNVDFLEEPNNLDAAIEKCMEISREAKCAVIIGEMDINGLIYDLYANAFAHEGETEKGIYLKHTMADNSPMGSDEYEENIDELFKPIILKGNRIGMTICYDCNHAAFSRVWGKKKVDIIINSTGGDALQLKWYRYNKVRSVENNCFSFCTMGRYNIDKNISRTYGFDPEGHLLVGKPLISGEQMSNIYVYTTHMPQPFSNDFIREEQRHTRSKSETWFIKSDYEHLHKLLNKDEELIPGLYCRRADDCNVIIMDIAGSDIYQPEKVLKLMYHSVLDSIENKRYFIINRWDGHDSARFEANLYDLLMVRATENFCAVLYSAPGFSRCIQSGQNRNVQILQEFDGVYGLELKRMGGPEVIWKNKKGEMMAEWRLGYMELINYLQD